MRVQRWNSHGHHGPSFSDWSLEEAVDWLWVTRSQSRVPLKHDSMASQNQWQISFAVCSATPGETPTSVDKADVLQTIIRAFNLDPQEVAAHSDTVEFGMHTDLLSEGQASSGWPIYSIAENVFGICWQWHGEAKATSGVIWFLNDEGLRQVKYILSGLVRHSHLQAHPLFIALLTLQVEVFEMRRWIQGQSEEFMDMQRQTGYHRYADIEDGIPLDQLDLTSMSKRICGLAVNVTTSALCLERIVAWANFITEQASCLADELASGSQDHGTESPAHERGLQQTNSLILKLTAASHIRAQGLLAEAEAWKQKANILVTTLLSLTNQRDQTISIQIAHDSRTLAEKATRDSTSMKAIAAVTMCFLPGTFVASLFAVPMFDWDAPLSRSVKRHFWLYWAVTLPLTLGVVIIWSAWTKRRPVAQSEGARQQPRLTMKHHTAADKA